MQVLEHAIMRRRFDELNPQQQIGTWICRHLHFDSFLFFQFFFNFLRPLWSGVKRELQDTSSISLMIQLHSIGFWSISLIVLASGSGASIDRTLRHVTFTPYIEVGVKLTCELVLHHVSWALVNQFHWEHRRERALTTVVVPDQLTMFSDKRVGSLLQHDFGQSLVSWNFQRRISRSWSFLSVLIPWDSSQVFDGPKSDTISYVNFAPLQSISFTSLFKLAWSEP